MRETEIDIYIETVGTDSFYITATKDLAQILMNDGKGHLRQVVMNKRGEIKVKIEKEIIFDTRDMTGELRSA